MLTLACDEVADGIVVGTYPQTPEDVRHLKDQLGVTAVLSLQDDDDLEGLGVRWDLFARAYQASGIVAVREPVKDFAPKALMVRLAACVAALDRLVTAGHRVYVHCTAGINRSPTVVIAWLHAHRGLPVAAATAQVTGRRQCWPFPEVLERVAELTGGR
jgi:hypothetical protein